MKKPSDESVSQEIDSVENQEENSEINDEAVAAPEESSENKKNKYGIDVSDYKFLKSRASVRHHSSGINHSSGGHSHHHHHHHRRRRRKKMKTWKKVLIIVLSSILALVIAALCIFQVLWIRGRNAFFDATPEIRYVPETVQAEVQEDGAYIVYKGSTYKYNDKVTSILFMGVDKRSIEGENDQGTGGQADSIVLIAMDVKSDKLTLIPVPRDTVTEVQLYTPGGVYNGVKEMQVCMAYAYGDGEEKSCENTVRAVRRIFYNIPVNTYYALDLDGIAEVNDSVGGVDVRSPETIGPFTEGEEYHLEGKLAENFVRLRDKTSVESSMKRLDRQKIYAKSFLSTMSKKIKSNIFSAVSIFNESSPYSCSNLDASRVTYLSTEFSGMSYDIKDVPGQLTYDNKYARYNIDDEKFFELFLSVYYEKM